ncbi:helix-turn-helix domain-containing protein [Streptomyces chumphonensis]|uniref:helix-turn-helix domain-containing protein n=1 Tax=Streptomyces chumphonensis TaxID=1214925 RepID=UPI003D73298F
MPSPKLIDLTLAVHVTRRPASTIRRWALEGRITRYPDPARRRNGVLYNLWELPHATRDEQTGEWRLPPPPPLPEHAHAA